MKRRDYLALTAATATTGGCMGSLQSESCSMDGKQFGFLSPGFESIEWVNLKNLKVTFEEDHGMDAFGVRHEHHDNYTDDIVYHGAPEFGGSKVIALIHKIQNGRTVYPTRDFDLYAYKGAGGSTAVIEEVLGHVQICIPEQIAPASKFKDL